MGSTEQHYSLRWNDYTVKIVTAFQSLRDEEDFVDVTVACDGHHYSAHKMVLSACSPYFRSLLRANPCQHPIVILKDVGHLEMERLLEFMYNGEVNIAQDQLAAFLKTAENLKIRGLAGSSEEMEQNQNKDIINNSNTINNTSGPTSGKTSPSAGFGSNMVAKEEDVSLDTSSVTYQNKLESPPSKRRKRIIAPATSQADNNTTSHSTDGILTESAVDMDGTGVGGGGLSMEDDLRMIDRREMKPEPTDALCEVYSDTTDLDGQHQGDQVDQRPVMYPIGIAGPSGTGSVGSQENLSSQEPGDVSALMVIANTVQESGPSERPIKCPLCQSIIKQGRNLRRHVIKRHLPAAKRGEITESDVKKVLEQKLKAITVTPLTDEELLQVHQRTRRRGVKAPRKKKGLAALPPTINTSSINESEVTVRRLPQKKERKDKQMPNITATDASVLDVSHGTVMTIPQIEISPREDILQEALAARDKDMESQDEVINLATTQQLPPLSVVVSTDNIQVSDQPMSLTVTQTACGIHARIPADAALHAGVRLQTDSPLPLHREISVMAPITFDPQATINENLTTYHTTSATQVISSSTSSATPTSYVPSSYWSATQPLSGLPSTAFQTHQPVFATNPSDYFTGVHVVRPSSLERVPQHRRKPYQ